MCASFPSRVQRARQAPVRNRRKEKEKNCVLRMLARSDVQPFGFCRAAPRAQASRFRGEANMLRNIFLNVVMSMFVRSVVIVR